MAQPDTMGVVAEPAAHSSPADTASGGSAGASDAGVTYRVTPSLLGKYFEMQCDKYMKKKARRTKRGGTGSKEEASALQQAIFDRGNDYEDAVLRMLEERYPGKVLDLTDDDENVIFSPEGIRQVLACCQRESGDGGMNGSMYLYQARLRAPHATLERLLGREVDASDCPLELGLMMPDFMIVTMLQAFPPRFQLTIVDVKSAMSVRLAHQVQVAFYALVIGSMIEERGLDWQIKDRGEVWTPIPAEGDASGRLSLAAGTFQAEEVPLALVTPFITTFFREHAYDLLQEASEPVWYMNEAACGHCEYVAECTAESVAKYHINTLPNLSLVSRRWLDKMTRARVDGKQVVDIEDIAGLAEAGSAVSSISARIDDALKVKEHDGVRESVPVQVWQKYLKEKETSVQPLLARTRLLPHSEELLVVLDLLQHPQSGALVASSILAVEPEGGVVYQVVQHGEAVTGEAFVTALSTLVHEQAGKKIQFYAISSQSRTLILQTLIAASVGGEGECQERAWQLLLVLSDDPSLLVTPLTRDDLNSFSVTGASMAMSAKVDAWKAWLRKFGIPVPETTGRKKKEPLQRAFFAGVLRQWGYPLAPNAANDLTLEDLQTQYHSALTDRRDAIARSPPRISCLMTMLEKLVAMPVPAFYTFKDCCSLLVPDVPPPLSEAELFLVMAEDPQSKVCEDQLIHRAMVVRKAIVAVRNLFAAAIAPQPLSSYLVETPRVCRIDPDMRLADPHLRKMLFMCQYEQLLQLEELRTERITASPTIVLRLLRCHSQDHRTLIADMEVISGAHLIKVESEAFGKQIMYLAGKEGELTADFYYVDLETCSSPAVRLYSNSRLATIDIIDFKDSMVQVKVYGSKWFQRQFIEEKPRLPADAKPDAPIYHVRHRLVDFTTKKLVDALFQCDAACQQDPGSPPIFVQLLRDPNAVGRLPPQTESWRKLAGGTNRNFNLKSFWDLSPVTRSTKFGASQDAAFQHAISHRLQLVWGPPGTGKTYYLTRSLLRMFIASQTGDGSGSFRVLATAFTKTAICHLLNELAKLFGKWKRHCEETLASTFDVDIVCISRQGSDSQNGMEMEPGIRFVEPGDKKDAAFTSSSFVIYGATTWQIYNTGDTLPLCDLVVIDEGSQLPLTHSLVSIAKLKKDTGGLIVVGDHLQLPPIVGGEYPQPLGAQEAYLYGSVLGGLMRDSDDKRVNNILSCCERNDSPCIVKLTNNRRSNSVISSFLTTLYGSNYTCASKAQDALLYIKDTPTIEEDLPRCLLGGPLLTHWQICVNVKPKPALQSLVTINVKTNLLDVATEQERLIEAKVVEQAVRELVRYAPRNVTEAADEKSNPCFIITPHRTQKYFLGKEVEEGLRARCKVDTVERMQGQEADVVILSCCYFDMDIIAQETDFIYHLERLNVAFSRAKKMVILVATDAVLNPGPEVLASARRRQGYAHLLRYVEASSRIDVMVDVEGGDAGKVVAMQDCHLKWNSQ